MHVVLQLAAKVLVAIFFAGTVGSMIVVLITFVEDLALVVPDSESADEDGRLRQFAHENARR